MHFRVFVPLFVPWHSSWLFSSFEDEGCGSISILTEEWIGRRRVPTYPISIFPKSVDGDEHISVIPSLWTFSKIAHFFSFGSSQQRIKYREVTGLEFFKEKGRKDRARDGYGFASKIFQEVNLKAQVQLRVLLPERLYFQVGPEPLKLNLCETVRKLFISGSVCMHMMINIYPARLNGYVIISHKWTGQCPDKLSEKITFEKNLLWGIMNHTI